MAIEVSDKETRAVFMNFKELRSLEKSVQSLDLEQAYSISLINLDQKVMKVNYKKLKDKVTRIRSHLGNDEIENMKQMEDEGCLDLKPSSSKVDFNIRIAAAAKRLKLQPRAKSAVPRLEGSTCSTNGNRYTGARAISARRSRPPIAATPRTPGTPSALSMNRGLIGSSMSTSISPSRPVKVIVDEAPGTPNFPVPRSVRSFRRNSIIIDVNNPDQKILSGINSANSLKGSTDSLESTGLLKHEKRSPSPSRPSTLTINNNNLGSGCRPVSPGFNSNLGTIGGFSSTKSPSYIQSPRNGEIQTSPAVDSQNKTMDSLNIPGAIRPMSVPSTKISNLGNVDDAKNRPKTAAQLAIECRKKSIAGIQRASTLLAEGKTRIPFSSHDIKAIEEKAKEKKPFRSIREGTFSVNMVVNDNTMGDDLHKEMKKGMILGEVATSLYLEDKIDTYLDKVDQYIKENPNYTYDPERTRAELEKVREANREAKKKKPKRNRLRRRQLEKRLQEENAMAEAAKSRYLRLSDDKIDTSGVNTLVIDQMKNLKKFKIWNIDSD